MNEFAVILAIEILLLFYEFLHQNFDYIIIKGVTLKWCHLKRADPPFLSYATAEIKRKKTNIFNEKVTAVSEQQDAGLYQISTQMIT